MKPAITCEQFDALLDLGDPRMLSVEARQHAAECPRCKALLEALDTAGEATVPAAALVKAQQAAIAHLKPVRPLSGTLLTGALAVAALAALVLVAVLLMGTHGWAARLPWQRISTYTIAGTVLLSSLVVAIRERVPGSSLRAGKLRWISTATALVWAAPLLLYGFQPEARFWKHGSACCCSGLLVGMVAAALLWFVLRRGYLVAPHRAGWFAGVTAGTLAFIVQETYCPVVESAHATLWHGGVIVTLGIIGWLVGPRLFRQD